MNEDFETNKNLLVRLIQRTEKVNFETKNLQQGATVSFYKKLLSSSKAILMLIDDAYNACILASHMLEALIQLIWMLEKKERIIQYVDYGAIEQLDGIKIYPDTKEKILSYIKERNVQRLLKKEYQGRKVTDKILLNIDNYCNSWYKPEANSIKTIAIKLEKEEGHPETNNLYHMYTRFCSYKHCSPYVMLPRYCPKPVQETPDAFLAITVSFQCLYICCLYVNKYQPAPVNLDDITEEYNSVLGVKWYPFK